MATAREGGESRFSHTLSSEDVYDLVCQPCHLDGKLQEAAGLCTDCQEYLCQKCFDVHTLPTPMRNHEMLNKKQMVQRQVSLGKKDKCSEKCSVHGDEVIKYYCLNHNHLGCNDCITIYHRSCDNVTYIPYAAKDLANNYEYKQAERQLESIMDRARKFTEDNRHKTEALEKDCSDAVKMVKEFRKEINEALDNIEICLVRQCETLKTEELEKITLISDNFKTTQADLQALKALTETYQNNDQNCNLYTVMMKAKETIKLAEERLKEVKKDQLSINSQIKFVPNKNAIFILKSSESFGKLSNFRASYIIQEQTTTDKQIRQEQTEKTTTIYNRDKSRTIVKAEYFQDMNVKSRSDRKSCSVSGLVTLPNSRLVIADSEGLGYGNGNIKLVKQGQVIAQLILVSDPWDVSMVTDSQVAVTFPGDKKVVFVNVAASAMNVDKKLDVNGECRGVDYRDGKLAVSFSKSNTVQILTLNGGVLFTLTLNKRGQALFNSPNYVVFGKDDTSLYVSNFLNNNVIHVKFDGTVVGTYTDSGLRRPGAVLIDNSGNVYVCGGNSNNIHQITPDCRNIQVLLGNDDSLFQPLSISYNEANGKLYVGMYDNNVVKVYKVILGYK